LVAGFLVLVAGCLVLGAGCWLLVAWCWVKWFPSRESLSREALAEREVRGGLSGFWFQVSFTDY